METWTRGDRGQQASAGAFVGGGCAGSSTPVLRRCREVDRQFRDPGSQGRGRRESLHVPGSAPRSTTSRACRARASSSITHVRRRAAAVHRVVACSQAAGGGNVVSARSHSNISSEPIAGVLRARAGGAAAALSDRSRGLDDYGRDEASAGSSFRRRAPLLVGRPRQAARCCGSVERSTGHAARAAAECGGSCRSTAASCLSTRDGRGSKEIG